MQLGRIRTSYRTDLVTVLLGTWFSLGLFLDAWAHSNVPELETFFTPWHAVFYSGFAATGAWIMWLVWRNMQQGRRGLDAVPEGYGLAVLALPLFALCGFGDYLWHTFIGIEQGIDILFSPTHLGLITSMIVILTTPLRTAWADKELTAPSLRRFLPAILSLAFTTALVLLFVSYADATVYGPRGIDYAFSFDKSAGGTGRTSQLAAAITITNLVLLTPLLFAARRFQLPPGTATIQQIVVMLLSTAVANYENLTIAGAFVLSGMVIDVLLWKLRPTAERLREYRIFAFAASLVTWVFYFASAGIAVGRMPTVTEMWTGAPLLAALHGLLLAVVLVPSRR